MRIIISGGGFVNKGAEAMLRTVQSQLSSRLPGVEFFLWMQPGSPSRAAAGSGFIPLLLPFDRPPRFSPAGMLNANPLLWSLKEWLRSRPMRRPLSLLAREERMATAWQGFLDRAVGPVSALIDVSGFAYGDDFGTAPFARMSPLVECCRRRAVPVFFLPQAWGPFQRPEVRRRLQRLLAGTGTRFYVRDRRSCQFLNEALGDATGAIDPRPDIAFAFVGANRDAGRRLLQGLGCDLERPLVGIAPNMRVYERLPGSGAGNPYFQALLGLMRHCLGRVGADVVLQANEIDASGRGIDDRYLCSLLAAAIGRPDRCHVIREPLNAEMTKALIGQFAFLVGSRYHSFVFSLSQGIPGLAISWAHKYRELFGQFGIEDAVQELGNLDLGELIRRFDRGWSERQDCRQGLLDKASRLHSDVESLFAGVAAEIHGG